MTAYIIYEEFSKKSHKKPFLDENSLFSKLPGSFSKLNWAHKFETLRVHEVFVVKFGGGGGVLNFNPTNLLMKMTFGFELKKELLK